MRYTEMIEAVNEAAVTMNNANHAAYRLAPLLVGRLRHCSADDLKQLKRELRDFNIHTGEWKDGQ